MNPTQKEIKVETLMNVISHGVGPGRTVVRIVSWNGLPPVLEKRQFILDPKTKEERPGKAKGLTLAELVEIFGRADEIKGVFALYDYKGMRLRTTTRGIKKEK